MNSIQSRLFFLLALVSATLPAALAAPVVKNLSDLFPKIDSSVLSGFNSSNVLTLDSNYATLFNDCMTYNNPVTCAGLNVMGVVNRAAEPDVHRTMNRMVVIRSNGSRRVVDVNVRNGKLTYDPSVLADNEIGIIYLTFFQGSETAPLNQCVAKVKVCGAGLGACVADDEIEVSSCFTAASPITPCDAGKTSDGGGSCIDCADSTYKPSQGPAACTSCVAPVIANGSASVAGSSLPRTSPNDCRIILNCTYPAVANYASMTCDSAGPPPSSCSMAMTVQQGAVSGASSSDGKLTVAVTGAVGPVSYTYTPTPSGSSLSGSSNTGTTILNLPAGSYTVSATDGGTPGCSKSATGTVHSPLPFCDSLTCTGGGMKSHFADAGYQGQYLNQPGSYLPYDSNGKQPTSCSFRTSSNTSEGSLYSACGTAPVPSGAKSCSHLGITYYIDPSASCPY